MRRAAVRLAEEHGFDETAAGRVALVVTELGTNLVRHAVRGRLLVAAVADDVGVMNIEVLSLDHGPRYCQCFRLYVRWIFDGWHAGYGPPGAVHRLSDEEFDMYSPWCPQAPSSWRAVAARLRFDHGAAPEEISQVPAFVAGAVSSGRSPAKSFVAITPWGSGARPE